jgi:hypothetical protein
VYKDLLEAGYGLKACHIGGPHDVQADLLQTSSLEAEDLGRVVGHVDNSALYDWTTVIHSNHNCPSVAQVGNPYK